MRPCASGPRLLRRRCMWHLVRRRCGTTRARPSRTPTSWGSSGASAGCSSTASARSSSLTASMPCLHVSSVLPSPQRFACSFARCSDCQTGVAIPSEKCPCTLPTQPRRAASAEALPNATLTSFSCCTLAGQTPALKRHTLAARRRRREQQSSKLRRTAEKLLLNQLKQHRLAQQQQARCDVRFASPKLRPLRLPLPRGSLSFCAEPLLGVTFPPSRDVPVGPAVPSLAPAAAARAGGRRCGRRGRRQGENEGKREEGSGCEGCCCVCFCGCGGGGGGGALCRGRHSHTRAAGRGASLPSPPPHMAMNKDRLVSCIQSLHVLAQLTVPSPTSYTSPPAHRPMPSSPPRSLKTTVTTWQQLPRST